MVGRARPRDGERARARDPDPAPRGARAGARPGRDLHDGVVAHGDGRSDPDVHEGDPRRAMSRGRCSGDGGSRRSPARGDALDVRSGPHRGHRLRVRSMRLGGSLRPPTSRRTILAFRGPTFPSPTSAGRTPMRTAAGPVAACPRRRNGSTPRVGPRGAPSPGALFSTRISRITGPGRTTGPTRPTVLPAWPRWVRSPTARRRSESSIWRATSPSGWLTSSNWTRTTIRSDTRPLHRSTRSPVVRGAASTWCAAGPSSTRPCGSGVPRATRHHSIARAGSASAAPRTWGEART